MALRFSSRFLFDFLSASLRLLAGFLDDDANRLASAATPTQFMPRGIVPGTWRCAPLQFLAFLAGAGTH
jgi:hypothetical protein